MTTIVIRPKNKVEENLLSCLLKKMNIDAQFVEEPVPNFETRKAMNDVELRKGTSVKGSKGLFTKLGI
ncbi:MAG: hypothetical protein WCI54_04240 [Bacteroidia bacterium]|jgi:hypothetical protein